MFTNALLQKHRAFAIMYLRQNKIITEVLFTDKGKLIERLGRKAIGPSARVVASFRRRSFFISLKP